MKRKALVSGLLKSRVLDGPLVPVAWRLVHSDETSLTGTHAIEVKLFSLDEDWQQVMVCGANIVPLRLVCYYRHAFNIKSPVLALRFLVGDDEECIEEGYFSVAEAARYWSEKSIRQNRYMRDRVTDVMLLTNKGFVDSIGFPPEGGPPLQNLITALCEGENDFVAKLFLDAPNFLPAGGPTMVLHGALGESKRWSHQSKWEAVDEVQKLVPEQFRRLCREDAEDVTTYDTVEDWVVPDLRDEDPDACDRRWSTGCDPILHPGMKGMKALIDDETRSAELKQVVFDNLYAFENGFNHPEPCPTFGNKSRARRDFLKDMKAVKESHSMKDSLMALARRLSKYGSTRRRETLREEFRFQVNVACGIPHEPIEHHRHATLNVYVRLNKV